GAERVLRGCGRCRSRRRGGRQPIDERRRRRLGKGQARPGDKDADRAEKSVSHGETPILTPVGRGRGRAPRAGGARGTATAQSGGTAIDWIGKSGKGIHGKNTRRRGRRRAWSLWKGSTGCAGCAAG